MVVRPNIYEQASSQVNLPKAISIWLLIVIAESANGTLREFLVTPAIGERPTHQIGFVVGSALILFIAWLMLSDYNLARGGLMSIGLVVMLFAPAFGAWLRAGFKRPQERHPGAPR